MNDIFFFFYQGFANFSWKFIKGVSAIIIPLMHLTKQNSHCYPTFEAQSAFYQFKNVFTTPALSQFDLAPPKILEVDVKVQKH